MRQYLFALIPFSISFLCLGCGPGHPSSPDLTPSKAGEINPYRPASIVIANLSALRRRFARVIFWPSAATTRGLRFGLSPSGSEGKPIPARAQFRWNDGAWHLYSYDYGDPPNVETV